MPALPALFSFNTAAWLSAALVAAVGSVAFTSSSSINACAFDIIDDTMYLKADCSTTQTLYIPDGMTLDGRHHTITAIDPDGGHFKGAVLKNAGSEAHVTNIEIVATNIMNVCDAGDDRLRGVLFEGAHGTIKHVDVSGVHQGASACQEGNGIEVRNAPFDGSGTNPVNVEIEHNTIVGFQKTGIVVNGDVWALVAYNDVGASATPQNLAANGIQLGSGASGDVMHNQVAGNQWCGTSDFAGTAILAYATAGEVNITKNRIDGNADIGVYAFSDDISITGNHLTDDQFTADCNSFGYDIGVGNYGSGNTVDKNIIKGFTTPLAGESGQKNVFPQTGKRPTNVPSPVL